jgi:transposase InsO family protein
MATATGFANIEKLNENNYELWKVQMKSVLIFNDLWGYVDGTEVKPEADAQDWTKKDSKALALINLSISHSQLNHVKKAATSKQAWDGLKAVFESRGPVRKAVLYKQLLRLEKKPDVSMSQYVIEFTSKAEQLAETGIDIPEELLSVMLLGSLPAEFENFSVAIESRDDIPSFENLKLKLVEEEARQIDRVIPSNQDCNSNSALVTKGRRANKKTDTQKPNLKCYNCGKMGHKSRICWSKPKNDGKNKNNENDAMTVVACNTELTNSRNTWYLDSGATRHMCRDRTSFMDFDECEQSKVYTAADHFVKSTGTGELQLDAKLNRRVTNPIKLKKVLCVPDLQKNLLSVSSVTDNGYTVTFGKDRATINRKDGTIVLTATKRDHLYVVNKREESAALVGENNVQELQKWHQRYGHLNVADLKKMKNEDMVLGMNFPNKSNDLKCETCAKCKIRVQPFTQSVNREKELLGLVHSDICGPIGTESLGGAKYFVTFIDDCSRYTETAMLRSRADVLQAFKDYKRKVENFTGRKIKKLRTDNGREYLSKNFENFLKEEGISRQLSVEYTPQQNGVAERANRTLVEMARCMMLQGNLPDSLWAEAVNTATYLRNRCATKCLNGITPFEAWSKRKPYVGFFRTIGSKAIALNKRQKRGKFQPKGDEYVLVGYSEISKAYRLWKPGTKIVIKARDVKFIEVIKSSPQTTEGIFDLHDPASDPLEEIQDETEQNFTDDEEDEETEEAQANESHRGPGRPKILRTGKRGRPKKIYQSKNKPSDPQSISQMLETDEKEA